MVRKRNAMSSEKASQQTKHAGQIGGAVGQILGRLKKVRRSGRGWTARCPAHRDGENSLSIAVGEDGRVLVKCFAGCAVEAIVGKLGLTLRDLFEESPKPRRSGGTSLPPDTTATVQPGGGSQGLTLAQYAEAKRLPVNFLRGLGIRDMRLQGQPALRIPYMDEQGNETAVRFRLSLDGDTRFRWRSGAKPCLYGQQRLADAREAGHVLLVEGESDTQTCWLYNVPTLGLPGASVWREEWAEHLEGMETIYVVVEPDKGGEAVRRWLSTSSIRDRVRVVTLGEAKDPSELHLQNTAAFADRIKAALAASVPWSEREQAEKVERGQWAWGLCEDLAQLPNILDHFAEELASAGVAGEARVIRLLYLCITSRLLGRPVSVAVKGPSSGGKSYLVERVLDYFPPSAYYALSAMSERALAYSEEPLSHRMMVIYEAAGLQGDFASYLMRSLLSEGRLRYETVEKTSEGLRPRLIEREGPTGLIVTTTAVRLHPENETRMLSMQVTDTPEQTRGVLLALADEDEGTANHAAWHALQEWLETGECRVTIPFSRSLAEAIPPVAVRLRRDFSAILTLIRAHALLHRASRQQDESGRVIATVGDYAAVRELVADLVAEGVEATVPGTVRDTVEAVRAVLDEGAPEATVAAVGRKLGLDKGAALRRTRTAISRGYLKNLETKRGRPARLVLDDPLPSDSEVLPRPEALEGCRVAGVAGEMNAPLTETQPPQDWPEECWEAYEERVAIMVVDGGLPEAEAQRQAVESVRRRFAL